MEWLIYVAIAAVFGVVGYVAGVAATALVVGKEEDKQESKSIIIEISETPQGIVDVTAKNVAINHGKPAHAVMEIMIRQLKGNEYRQVDGTMH